MVHIGEKCGFYAVHTALSSHSHEHDRAIKPGREEGYSWQKTFTWVARKIHTHTHARDASRYFSFFANHGFFFCHCKRYLLRVKLIRVRIHRTVGTVFVYVYVHCNFMRIRVCVCVCVLFYVAVFSEPLKTQHNVKTRSYVTRFFCTGRQNKWRTRERMFMSRLFATS